MRDEYADGFGWRCCTQRIGAPMHQFFRARFFERVTHFVLPAGNLGALHRKEPMHIGVLQLEHGFARRADAAWLNRAWRFAEHALREPKAEPLFADAGGSVEEERAGQLAACERSGEGPANF